MTTDDLLDDVIEALDAAAADDSLSRSGYRALLKEVSSDIESRLRALDEDDAREQ